jgi:ATP-dependent DNA helicase Rep
MALSKETVKEDPREKIKALRAEFAQRAVDAAALQAASQAATPATAKVPAWE